MFCINPEYRAEYITGLRELADYLEANPGIPVPMYGTGIVMIARDAEAGGVTDIFELSLQLGAPFIERDGSYKTELKFGPITFTAYSSSTVALARQQALDSYYGSVTPEADYGASQTPAQWLIAEYEATSPADIIQPDDDDDINDWLPSRSVVIQPLFTLKSVMDAGEPMHVSGSEYDNPVRRLL